jgi:hypothetical protein
MAWSAFSTSCGQAEQSQHFEAGGRRRGLAPHAGLLRLAAGTLWVPIGLHGAWDFIENGIVTTRLLPARGPALEQTTAGWLMPILIIMAVLLVTRWWGQCLNWRSKVGEHGESPATKAAVGG